MPLCNETQRNVFKYEANHIHAHNQVTEGKKKKKGHRVELVLELRSASGNAFFGKSRRLISLKDQTPVSAPVSVIVLFAYVFFFFSLEHFSIGVIVDDHRLPVYVACVIVQTCQRTERGVCLISLRSSYNPVCCVIACHREGS